MRGKILILMTVLCIVLISTMACGGDGQTAQSHLERGNEYLEAQELDKAIEHYTSAIDLDANLADAYSYRALAYGGKGQLDPAIADLSSAIDINPGSGQYYLNRGHLYALKGMDAEAIRDFEQCIAVSGDPAVVQAANDMLSIVKQ